MWPMETVTTALDNTPGKKKGQPTSFLPPSKKAKQTLELTSWS